MPKQTWLKSTALGMFLAGALCSVMAAVTDSQVFYVSSYLLLIACIGTILVASSKTKPASQGNPSPASCQSTLSERRPLT